MPESEKIKLNSIFNNDARYILDVINSDVKIKTTITSPPYFDMKDYGSSNQVGYGQSYNEYLDDLQNIFENIFKITDDDGSLWIIIDSFKRDNQVVTLPFDLSNKLKQTGWFLQDIIIWKKDKTVPWSQKGFVQRKFEYILFFTKTTDFKYNKDKVRNYNTDQLKKWWVKYPERYSPKGKALDEIWEFPIPVQGSWGDRYVRHFCPLPKEMVATMIEISTDVNDIVLDPFAGSGSVLFQSAVMDRKYIGFEVNHEYIDMFNKYLANNLKISIDEYDKLQKVGGQEEFKQRILDLRALKFGRLLVNNLDEKFGLNLKVFVEIQQYIDDSPKDYLSVEYQIIGEIPSEELILNEINILINKPPLSKFGIRSTFKMLQNKKDNKKYYRYTKTNTYAFTDLPLAHSQVKVFSQICVNLNEDDYN